MKKREDVGTNHFNDPNAFTQCSNRMNDVYQNIDDYNPSRKRRIFVWWHDCKHHDKQKFQAIIKELFISRRKVNISLAFVTQSYFSVPKDVGLTSTHYLIMRINNRNELQNIAINHSADIDYNDFVRIYRECTRKPYSFLTIDTTLLAGDPIRLRKNLLLPL